MINTDLPKFLERFTPQQRAKILELREKSIILGVHGKAQHGKNTTASILMDTNPYLMLQEASFADGLKSLYEPLCKTPYINTGEFKAAENPVFSMTNRDLLIRVGIGLRDCVDQDIWIKTCLETLTPGMNYIFTDVRFKNEFNFVEAIGGRCIRVFRPDFDNGVGDNPSETDLGDVDMPTVINDGDLAQLCQNIKAASVGVFVDISKQYVQTLNS